MPKKTKRAKPGKRKQAKKTKDKGCSRCDRVAHHGEAFRCYRNTYKFNIDTARKIIADGRQPVEMDIDDIDYSLDRAEINKGHIPHVNPDIPGIVSFVFMRSTDGELVRASRLIDGHHRAARCRQLERPFLVHVLSEEESITILERCPEDSIPERLKPYFSTE